MELNQAQKSRSSILRPQTHALALEPRIMFDGAAATAADQHQNNDTAHANTPASADPATRSAATAAPIAAGANSTASTPAPTAQAPALNLVVIDARVDGREQLQANLPAGSRLLVVDNQTDGLAAISAALAELGHVDSIQIFSHGASGQFTLGSTTLNATTLESSAQVLSSWRAELNAGADIQLYGCNVGAGNAGQTLVNELARLTGADVGASSDATGSAQAGGNWTLEVVSGAVDKPLALGAEAVSAYAGLLLDAAPLATIDATGSDVLLGDSVSFVVNFTNTTTQVGFAPYIDLYLPATGKDGDDGVTFGSASYLGQTLTAITVTFDPAGNATHPLARDANGKPIVITAASVGMQPGDKMIVLSLPYGSVASDQPVIPINVTLKLSNFADTSYSNGAPNLDVKVRGGFELGNDALNNPAQDPSLALGALDTF
ncbi:MAG TPA: DUF4347 domain-containing protein, partial [Variovorax sp.]|nr:DUF4347 domain-containing protein [Variovorax sp.]